MDWLKALPLLATLGGNTADAVTTHQAINRGAQEGNPLLPGNPWKIDAIKAGTTGGEMALEHWLQQHGHEKVAAALGLGIGGLGAGLAIHNAGVQRRKP